VRKAKFIQQNHHHRTAYGTLRKRQEEVKRYVCLLWFKRKNMKATGEVKKGKKSHHQKP